MTADKFDRWLGVLNGPPDGLLSGEALARQATDVVLNITNRVVRPPGRVEGEGGPCTREEEVRG